jgi:hypothetical protein
LTSSPSLDARLVLMTLGFSRGALIGENDEEDSALALAILLFQLREE